MGYKINVLIDSQQDIFSVFVRQRRQSNMYTRHIDTLMRTQHTIILHLGYNCWTIDTDDKHVKGTIIKQHMVTFVYVGCKIRIRKVDDIVGGIHFGASEYLNHITLLILNRLITARGSHLGSLGVNKDTNVAAYFAHVPYYIY